jgi:predicted PhzF superfamily epimerase YddE/YHI9
MPDVEETPSRHDLEAKIIKHSWDDPAFREKFIADPKGTIAKYTGLSAGSLPEIVVHEEKVGTWHIVLPVKPADAQELSDADLEKVAGGTTPTISLVSTVTSLILTPTQSISESEGGW